MKRFALTLRTCVLVVFGAASVLRAQTSGQLYLVTGVQLTQDQTLKVPSAVYSVDASKRVATPVAELAGPKDGSLFVQADHDRRVIVIGSAALERERMVVLSMDAPSKPRSIPVSYDGWFGHFFLFENGEHRLIEAFRVGPCCTQDRLIGFDLLAADSKAAATELSWNEDRYFRREGAWPPGDDTRVEVFPRGEGLLLDPYKGTASLGVSLPASIKPEQDDFFSLAVNNDEMLVINRAKFPGKEFVGEGGTTELLVYDKKFQRWSAVRFPGEASAVRGFGHWLVLGHRDLMQSLQAFLRNEPSKRRESPGSERRKTWLRSGSDERDGGNATVDDFFRSGRYYHPGIMYLYDVRSQKRYEIKTSEGDSEILLVDGDTVYYRVNQNLYSAAIGTSELGNSKLILSDETVQLSHWAFIGPPSDRKQEAQNDQAQKQLRRTCDACVPLPDDPAVVQFAGRTATAQQPTLTVVAPKDGLPIAPGSYATVLIRDGPGNPGDWIALARVGTADTDYVQRWYLGGNTAPPASGLTAVDMVLPLPEAGADYEFRFFANSGYTRLATSALFTRREASG